MKIGIITFHWAINLGAVIQAYALQEALVSLGHKVEIINYLPWKVRLKRIKGIIYLRNTEDIRREYHLHRFRKNWLKLSTLYSSNKVLSRKVLPYDTIVCGSDQIWNEWFTMNAEGGPTSVYYLSFVGEVRKISYAASFGSSKIKLEMVNYIKPFLQRFDVISMRENSGVQIIKNLGLEASLVCDPTLLYGSVLYEKIAKHGVIDENTLFSYILHGKSHVADQVIQYVENILKIDNKDSISNSIEEWLGKICDSVFVVTNSFHCAVFSIIFHTPFAVVSVSGFDMGDRLFTLLNAVGLSNRYVQSTEELKSINLTEIDWDDVDRRRQEYSDVSWDFLKKNLINGGNSDEIPF